MEKIRNVYIDCLDSFGKKDIFWQISGIRPYKSQIRFLNVVGGGVVLDCLAVKEVRKKLRYRYFIKFNIIPFCLQILALFEGIVAFQRGLDY